MKPTKPASDRAPQRAAKENRTSSSTERGATPRPNERRASRRPAAGPGPYADDSLRDACSATPRLHAFLTFVDAAGMAGLLQGEGPLTVFAPTDRAFSKVPSAELTALLNDKPRLIQVIQHHVVSGRVKAPRDQQPRSVTPQFGNALQLTATDGNYHVDEARIVRTNLRASNGVIHAIDTLLIPGA